MAIITKSELRNLAGNIGYSVKSSYLSKTVNLSEAKSRRQTTIFLSHSHTDRDVIEAVIVFLKSRGVLIYVDWKDSSMPAVTNASTATKLKDKIREHDKFILLASPSALKSNWVNWELGFGDAHKYISNIAIFPTVEYSGEWRDAEYLAIYPRIEKESRPQMYSRALEDIYFVIRPDGTKIELTEWLRLI